MHRNLNIKIREPAPGLLTATKVGDQPPPAWRGPYPNLADNFSFSYWQLLNLSYQNNTGLASGSTKRVAVIGAGIAGTEVARELARSGYQVDLIEASNRIGGRTNSFRAPDGSGGAQLTCYEQGAMRIPFFNRGNPTKPGPGPYVGGPFVSDTASAQSCAEFWANKYTISTAAFPDPGKAPGPALPSGQPTFPGVATGIFVNQGFGVDLASLYTNGASSIPKTPFLYNWPDTSPDIPLWPTSDPYLFNPPVFYNRGQQMNVPVNPPITLGHAIPNDDANIPPTFSPSDPNYAANVKGWRLGVNALRTVAYKWSLFASAFLYTIGGTNYEFDVNGKAVYKNPATGDWTSALYNSSNWENFWVNSVMPRYQNVNFYEVAMAGPILPIQQPDGSWQAPPEWLQGNFGGLGCSAAEAQVFYTIGAGDGSWGAFFPNSALWALRALLFGFATQHQLILGCLNDAQTGVNTSLYPPPDQTPQGGNRGVLVDSAGNEFWAPQYTGVNCFSECHFFKVLETTGCLTKSFWDLVREKAANFYSSSKVTAINKVGFESIQVTYTNVNTGAATTTLYNYVVLTVPIWNTQTDMNITGFDVATQLPMVVSNALDTSHWIRSCKVFVALKQPYWKQGPNDPRTMQFIPQVLATNTELQDMYGLNGPTGTDPWPITGGIALISYTWEDDAQKFLSFQEKDLVVSLLDRLERLLAASGLPGFKQFMQDPTLASPGSYTVWRWSLVPTAHGCAKAYQEGIENLNYSLLTYNKVYASQSQLYFAGDAYSLESGWLEPALRMGLDVVLNLANNDSSATVTNVGGFNFAADYLQSNPLTTQQAQRTAQLGPSATAGGVGSGKPNNEGGNGGGNKPAEGGKGGCCTSS